MKARTVGLGVSLLALVGLGWGSVQVRRSVEGLDARVDSQWSQVEYQLALRHDLLPRLVPVARVHAGDRPEVFEELAAARMRYLQAPASERPAEAPRVDAAVQELLLLARRSPDLEADPGFRDLRREVAAAQERIAVERERYNDQVSRRNERIRRVPWRFFAAGWGPRPLYDPRPAAPASSAPPPESSAAR